METNRPPIGCRQRIGAEPDPRAIAPLDTHSQSLEICLSTCTEPCTIDWPIDRHSGKLSHSPENPTAISLRRCHRDQARAFCATVLLIPSRRSIDGPALARRQASVRHLEAHRRGTGSLLAANAYATVFIFPRSASDQFFND